MQEPPLTGSNPVGTRSRPRKASMGPANPINVVAHSWASSSVSSCAGSEASDPAPMSVKAAIVAPIARTRPEAVSHFLIFCPPVPGLL